MRGGRELAAIIWQLASRKKGPPFRRADNSAIYFYVNAGAPFSPDLHVRFSHTPTLLDCHIGLADAPPDCHVGGRVQFSPHSGPTQSRTRAYS